MSNVFHRSVRARYPTAVAGDGCYLIDREGRRYLDASGGAAVSCLGHSERRVQQAIAAQASTLAYAHTSFFTNGPMEALADRLVAGAPPGIERVYFVSGGSEGMEAALKMARQYFLEAGQPDRHRIIARRQSYHGNTLGVLAAGGNAMRRAPFQPLLVEMAHVSPCYAYRDKSPSETEEAYAVRLAEELDAAIRALGPGTVAAFVAETVVGATLGAVPPVPGYFKRVREVCDRHGVLLILDEVMCGMGRTGTLHACEQDGVAPDIMVVAKGLGAGYQPIGAVLVSGRVYKAFEDGSGVFQHGHTYIGHPVACAAALAVQDILQVDGLLANVVHQGRALRSALEDRFGNHCHVGDIRGRGLFLGLELVRDRGAKTPFDPALRVHARIKQAAMELGLLCYPMGGTVDGTHGDHILLAPPFILTPSHVDEVVDKLGRAIDAVVAALPTGRVA
ncbi:MAG TPA: aspartate aminotransferase family protein [Azospirillaceae bacterium]|nr:aspartate aminotransferase family protein [Azospirillaceae bacterium]